MYLHVKDHLITVNNILSGTLPTELGQLENLERLFLCKCDGDVVLCLNEFKIDPFRMFMFVFFLIILN